MSKSRSLYADYAVYLLVRVFVCVIQTLSLNAAQAFAAGLAWLAYRLDRRHREVASDNLRQAFPNRYTEAEIDRMVRAIYRHFCGVLVEIIQLPRRLHANNWRRHLEVRDGRVLVDALLSDRPLMCVTGHFGNWEMAGYALGLLGFTTHAIARPLDNPFLDDFLRRFREATGQRILAKKGDFDQMQAILASGGIIGTLADQDAGQRGLFVDFFGRPASTHKAIALLSMQFKVPLLVVGTAKVGEPARYQAQIEDVIRPEAYEGKADAMSAITQRFTSALERLVCRFPEQYFWLHRRWKHQPAKRRQRAA